MRNFYLFSVLLFVIIFLGCEKGKEDFQQILTSTSWEEIDSVYTGKLNTFKSLYKVTFNDNGEFEIIYRQWGVNSRDSISRDSTERIIIPDTIFGKYSYLSSENKIQFKPVKIKMAISDTASILYGCDSLQYFIADWQIQKISTRFLETHGLNPDTINHSNCFMIGFLGDYKLRPLKTKFRIAYKGGYKKYRVEPPVGARLIFSRVSV